MQNIRQLLLAIGLLWLPCASLVAQEQDVRLRQQCAQRVAAFIEAMTGEQGGNLPTEHALALIMEADVMGWNDLSDPLKANLFLYHPTSLLSRYIVTTLPNDRAFRKLLSQQFLLQKTAITPTFCQKFAIATRLGAWRYKQSLFADSSYLTQVLFAAKIGGDRELEQLALRVLMESKQEDARQIALIVADDRLTARRRFECLQEFRNSAEVKSMQWYYLAQVAADDKLDESLLWLAIENALLENKHNEAISFMEQLNQQLTDPSPRLTYYKGLALWGNGQQDAAGEAFRTLEGMADGGPEEFVEPWIQSGSQFAKHLDAQSDRLNEVATGFQQIIEQALASGLGGIECDFHYVSEHEKSIEGGLRLDQRSGRVELSVYEGDEPLLVVAISPEESRWYIHGGREIHVVRPGKIPTTTFQFRRDLEGKFHLDFNFQVSSDLGQQVNALEQLLRSPYLNSYQAIKELLAYSITGRVLLLPNQQVEDQLIFSMLQPNVKGGVFDEFQLVLNSAQQITEVNATKWQVKNIRYGNGPLSEKQIARFPQEIPETLHAEVDGTLIGVTIAEVSSLFKR